MSTRHPVVNFASGFIELMQKAGETFSGMVVGTIPMLVTLLTLVNFVVRIVGEDKINNLARVFAKSFSPCGSRRTFHLAGCSRRHKGRL